MGERNQSIERYRHILSQDPEQANALKSLSELVSGDALVELERPVADALAHVKKGSEDEAYLLFARANIFVGKGDRARSDQDVTRANRFLQNAVRILLNPTGTGRPDTGAVSCANSSGFGCHNRHASNLCRRITQIWHDIG